MACTRPLKAYRGPGGKICFNVRKGFYDQPLELPCARCMACRIAKSREWAIRCVHESQMYEKNCFLTLTYSDKFLPKDLSLDVEHWQKFAKRLRRRLGPFRFFHCGEYGEKNMRPHYHALLFGQDFSEDRYAFQEKEGRTYWRSPLLEECWKYGFSTIGTVTFQSASYVARYCQKKLNGVMADIAYQRVDDETGEVWAVKPEYLTMSRRPGLGAGWFEKFGSDVFPCDFVVSDGRKFRPPLFYDVLLGRKDKVLLSELKAKRRAKALADPESFERMAVREVCVEAKSTLKSSVL